MYLRDLDDVRKLFASLTGTFIGAGMTAYSRITPAAFLSPYRIVALRNTLDLPILRAQADIFCLEEELGETVQGKGLNSAFLLAHPLVRQFLKRPPKPIHILLYQNYPDLADLEKEEGWTFLANPADLRIRVSERAFFKKMVSELGLPRAPGAIYPVPVIQCEGYESWTRELGPEFVVQLPDIRQGGGRGTFFIRTSQDYECLKGRLKDGFWRGVKLNTVSIHKYLHGIPASVAMCLTRHGVLTSRLQRQLIDLPYCKNLSEDGIFCGHVWDEVRWSARIDQSTRRQTGQIGRYLWAMGYRGILGIDFVADPKNDELYPIEINPRLTGAFPMLSLLYLKEGKIPLEAFHILEFLNVHYNVDVEALNEQYARPIKGSHLLLFLQGRLEDAAIGRLSAGLYERDPEGESVAFVGKAVDYQDITNSRQFIVTDGLLALRGAARDSHCTGRVVGDSRPGKGSSGPGGVFEGTDPPYRLCRALFSDPIAGPDGKLSAQALKAIAWIYEMVVE